MDDVTPEEGARALLDRAFSDKSSYAVRARAISCVFRLLPALAIQELYRFVRGAQCYQEQGTRISPRRLEQQLELLCTALLLVRGRLSGGTGTHVFPVHQ